MTEEHKIEKFGTQKKKSVVIHVYRNGDKVNHGARIVLKSFRTMEQVRDFKGDDLDIHVCQGNDDKEGDQILRKSKMTRMTEMEIAIVAVVSALQSSIESLKGSSTLSGSNCIG
jgi:hypothetical protein